MELRLGDIIDDHCIKCRRLTNHSVVSILEGEVAKVRCRSCYHEHMYLREIAPPSRKDLKKAELANAALAANDASGEPAEVAEQDSTEEQSDAPALSVEERNGSASSSAEEPAAIAEAEEAPKTKPARSRARKA